MDIQFFIELFFGGLTRGSIYALIALGYTLVYGIIELINFAHGEIYMLGAFTALLVAGVLGVYGFPAAGILIIAALAAVIWCAAYGFTLEKVAYKPLRGAPRLSPLISAIGMSIFLQNYVLLAQTSDFVPFPRLLPEMEFLEYVNYVMGPSDFLILLVSTLAMVALSLFIRFTRMGKAMRATAQNRKMALLLGINADWIISLTFIIGSGLAALGGVLIASHMGQVNFGIGFLAGLKAFTAAVLGGIGSIPGAMVGGLVLGLAGQLVLGYVAFYAVGAYAYGLLYQFFGWGFWACLPVGGVMAVLFGLALGFPVLRLRGDYLAIVTLGFGEIVRLGLQNWTSLTGGPRGISEIPRPGFFGMEMDINTSTTYVYYLVLAAVVITIIVISRLKNSRVGLALQALREDEIAGEAMGIDITRVKLSAFALGSCWAGFAGVIFAAKTTYINPSSFTFMESAMILSMVVLGGMGSIAGVAIAAMILILAPEYLRAFSEYRMLIFGAIMVIMMIFRPQGLISGERRRYRISALHGAHNGGRS